jgi:hypothetical protein
MTDLLQKAITEIRKLPSERQDMVAEMLLAFVAQESEEYGLSPEQVAEVERRLAGPADYASTPRWKRRSRACLGEGPVSTKRLARLGRDSGLHR